MPSQGEEEMIKAFPGETQEAFVARLREYYYKIKEEKRNADEKKRKAATQRPGRLRPWIHYTNYLQSMLDAIREKLSSLGESVY